MVVRPSIRQPSDRLPEIVRPRATHATVAQLHHFRRPARAQRPLFRRLRPHQRAVDVHRRHVIDHRRPPRRPTLTPSRGRLPQQVPEQSRFTHAEETAKNSHRRTAIFEDIHNFYFLYFTVREQSLNLIEIESQNQLDCFLYLIRSLNPI